MSRIDECCEKTGDIKDERILIFGGSGSLGKTAIMRWKDSNKIINVSRDEEKQWSLRSAINSPNLSQIVGDISIQEDVDHAILTAEPTVVCIFACLKHIDLCEKYPKKSVSNNVNGIMNVHNTLMKYKTSVHTVLFVSTDKACLPITTYGCCKAISEFFLQGVEFKGIKWVGVRYGNVLNSSGSILPYLHANKHTPTPYTLTHPDMTRFIMTLDQSVNLIEHALVFGNHNELIIPQLNAMRIQDLFTIFEKRYNKTTAVTGLRCKEKIHEDLISTSECKMAYRVKNYYHIGTTALDTDVREFDSSMSIVNTEQLETYLGSKSFL